MFQIPSLAHPTFSNPITSILEIVQSFSLGFANLFPLQHREDIEKLLKELESLQSSILILSYLRSPWDKFRLAGLYGQEKREKLFFNSFDYRETLPSILNRYINRYPILMKPIPSDTSSEIPALSTISFKTCGLKKETDKIKRWFSKVYSFTANYWDESSIWLLGTKNGTACELTTHNTILLPCLFHEFQAILLGFGSTMLI